VSSFTETIQKQLEQRHIIWGDNAESILPTTATFSFVQTGYAPVLAQGRGEWNSCSTWKDAVDQVEEAVLSSKSEIVLIGCGGLGLPLAQRLKKAGKVAIVLGGAIQVLFGIKGDRWKTHSVISHFWNPYWVYPSIHETPKGAHGVENACYWKS
jgi:Asp/Glu/hydantoin racemase